MSRKKGSLNKPKEVEVMSQQSNVAVLEEVKQSDETVLESLESEIDRVRMELEQTKLQLEQKKLELRSVPQRDISPEEQVIVDKQISGFDTKKNASEVIAKQKAYDNVKVTGKFMNRRCPGKSEKLPYLKYADDPVVWKTFHDGQVYTIPRGFADQINEHYHTPIFTQKQGPQEMSDELGENSMIADVDRSNKKFAFVPVAF